MKESDHGFNRPLALLVAAAFFMENLDGTIIQTAAPAIARDFGITAVEVTLAITGYLLAVAIGVPASGWLAKRFGTRRIFLFALAIFALASVACALSQGLDQLTAARMLQGIGGAMMVPVGRFAVLQTVHKHDLLSAIAYLTWPALAAPLIAPALGGILSDTVGWRWIFLINIPIAVACWVAGTRILSMNEDLDRTPFDLIGFVLSSVSLSALVLAMQQLTYPHVSGGLAAALFVVAIVGGVSAVVWMMRAGHPLLQFAALKIPSFRAGNTGGALYRLLVSAAPYLFTLLFQVGFGWSASLAGVLVVAIFIGNVAVKPATTTIIRRFGFRRVLIGSNVAGAILFVLSALLVPATPLWMIVVLLVTSGALRSLGFTAYQSLQFADIEPQSMSEANALGSTVQQIALALGIAFAAVVVRTLIAAAEASGVVAGNSAASPAYSWAFIVVAALMAVPALGAWRLRADAGAHLVIQ